MESDRKAAIGSSSVFKIERSGLEGYDLGKLLHLLPFSHTL
jgi:hypothetical protein